MEFDPERRKLIETVLQPLERRDEARVILEQCVASAAVSSSDKSATAVRKATERMNAGTSTFRRFRRTKGWLAIVALLVVLWTTWLRPGAREQLHRIRTTGTVCMCMRMMDGIAPPFIPGYNGNFQPSDNDLEESWKEAYRIQSKRMNGEGSIMQPPFAYPGGATPLINPSGGVNETARLHPGDPARVLRATSRKLEKFEISDEEALRLLDEFEKLDPDNGILHLEHASTTARLAIAEHPYEPVTSADRKQLALAIEELQKASSYPRWDDYRLSLWESELADWPPARDFPEQAFATVILLPNIYLPGWWGDGHLPLLLSAWIEIAAANSDPAALDNTAIDFDSLRYRWSKIATNYMGRTLQADLIHEGAETLAHAYAIRGGKEQASRYDELAKSLENLGGGFPAATYEHMGFMGSHMPREVSSLAETEDEGITAGRMAEYAMWERFTFHVAALLLVILGLSLLNLSGRGQRKCKGLAPRLTQMLTARDRLVIVLGGVGIPAAIYFATTRWLPVREETMQFPHFLMMLDQMLLMIGAMLFTSAYLTRIFLTDRAHSLGFRKGLRLFDAFIACYCLIGIPLCAFTPEILAGRFGWALYAEIVSGAVLLMPLLWVAVRIYRWRSVPAEVRVLQAAQIRVCVPGICLAAVLAAGSTFALHSWESRLVAKMTLGSVQDPQLGFVSPAQTARAEKIRQALAK